MGERRSRKLPERSAERRRRCTGGGSPQDPASQGASRPTCTGRSDRPDDVGLDGTLTYEQDGRGRDGPLVPQVDISLLPTDPDEAALGYLAMMCDGATSKDDVGFGMSDAVAGHLLAARIGQSASGTKRTGSLPVTSRTITADNSKKSVLTFPSLTCQARTPSALSSSVS